METIKNYRISRNNVLGRYMVAAKNIKAGELILSEKPTLVGSPINGPLICFNCCRNVTNTGYIFCRECKTATICSPKCTDNLHNPGECFALKEANVEGSILAENSQLIFPLRCLILKKYNPGMWDEMMKLEAHLNHRRNTPVWRRNMITVERILREMNFLSEEDLKEELVQTVCGILDVNTFEIRPPHSNAGRITNPEIQCLRGLYLEAALMAHDCIGNTHLSVDDDFVLNIRASIDIPENSPIFFNYSNVLQGNFDRGQHLREGKYFECSCRRCTDPTELGTELSSLRCHKCRKGLIRSKDATSDWECSECKENFKNHLITLTVMEGRRRIEDVDQTSVRDMEDLFNKLLQTFHPNHYLILELQQNLIGLYIRSPPTKYNLSRRIELCRGLLEVLSKIELGLSRLKAITLYEMQTAMVDVVHKLYRDKELNEDELIQKLLLAENTLKEAIKHLLYEPPKSPEGRLAQVAFSELKALRMSIFGIQKDFLSINGDRKANNKHKKVNNKANNNKTDTKPLKVEPKENKNSEKVNYLDNPQSKSIKKKSKNKK